MTVTYFSKEETLKKYKNETVTVGDKTYPLRVTFIQRPTKEDNALYSNVAEEVLFYYTDPENPDKIKVLKKETVKKEKCRTIIHEK